MFGNLFKEYQSPSTPGGQVRGAITKGVQIEGSSSHLHAEQGGRDSVQESMAGLSRTERAEAETWESIPGGSVPRERRSTRTNSTAHRPRDDSAQWKEKFNQTERTLAESQHQLGIMQKESDAKERRLDKITAECNGLRADMKEKDNKLSHAKSCLREAQKENGTAKGQMLRKGIECDSLRAEKEGNLALMKDQQRRMESVVAERNELRVGMVEKDSNLADVQVQLAQWRCKAQEATTQAHEDAPSFRKMTQDREGEANVLRAEITSVRAQLDSALKLLDDRKLQGAQPFVTGTDSFSSPAEAMGLVQALNDDIFQLSAFMSDSFQAATTETPADEDSKGVHHRIKGHLGDQLMVSLTSWPHTDDPTVLQMTLQCYLVQMSRQITSDWTFDGSSPVLAKLYEQVRRSEDQAVARRWRALSRSHLRHLSTGGEDALSGIRKHVCGGLADILISAKCQSSPLGVVEALTSRFGERIYAIIDTALNIKRILGEEITSGDFEIVTCQAGVTFDPMLMEDAASDVPLYDERNILLCTTEMGFRRESWEVKGGQRAKEVTLLLKPKVALESVLAQISSAGETRPEYTIEEYGEVV
ncbi:hypothetical protein FIBSPDRAFT_1039528 [Athelia psychrophila]|uniref:Uncharacterized protein n=1 Tax=Athelia psychrophila TaxID=1759441 RepID=A0A166RL95_9AGAM|nr:hypothetical protein FIBSPDRAFT_1039528 [Fibularhizoctonia sp. CBS 109695]